MYFDFEAIRAYCDFPQPLFFVRRPRRSHSRTSATQYGSIDLTSVRLGVFPIQEDCRHINGGRTPLPNVQSFCNTGRCREWPWSSVLCLCPLGQGYPGTGWSGRSVWRAQSGRVRTQDIGLLVRDVERLVCHAVLIHLDCETEPGFWVRIRRSSLCHSCEGHRDPTVKALAELDHDGFWVSVSGIVN